MGEMKPCPFCNGAASLALCGFGTARVTCMDCGSEGQYSASRDAAIAAWNRRSLLESGESAASSAMGDDGWRPIETAPKDGREILAWFQKLKLDDNDDPTDEVVGGAMAPVQWQGESWMEPGWLEASGAFFFDDWCFAAQPVMWHPLPPPPGAASPSPSNEREGK